MVVMVSLDRSRSGVNRGEMVTLRYKDVYGVLKHNTARKMAGDMLYESINSFIECLSVAYL